MRNDSTAPDCRGVEARNERRGSCDARFRAGGMSGADPAPLDAAHGTQSYLTNGHSPSFSGRNAWSAGIVALIL
jgi:hypothetical protein